MRTTCRLRAIPTRVGTTWRGLVTGAEAVGPSPRVWGLRGGQACSGAVGSGHPHACGDYEATMPEDRDDFGPSPRVWGLRGQQAAQVVNARAIPTRVGTTQGGLPAPHLPPGHPHACGDYGEPHNFNQAPNRAIPTRVGTTGRVRLYGLRPPGHPHACGDYTARAPIGLRARGPSPRVWGLPTPRCPTLPMGRAIPTRVGTTSINLWPSFKPSGHPHACGDYCISSVTSLVDNGPSPRVWGLRGLQTGLSGQHRAIPTRVGTT